MTAEPPGGPRPSTSVRTLTDVPRTDTGTVDVDQLVDLLSPCDLYESAVEGPTYIVPHTGALFIADDTSCRLTLANGDVEELPNDPFDALDEVCDRLGVHPDAPHDAGVPAITGALAGAFAYDLGRYVETLPRSTKPDRPDALLYLRVAEVVVSIDAGGQQAVVAARDSALVSAAPQQLVAEVAARMRAPSPPSQSPDAATTPPQPGPRTKSEQRPEQPAVGTPERAERTPPADTTEPAAPTVTSSLSEQDHTQATRHILEAISAGEVFQVNLTQRLTASWAGDTHGLYRALRHHSPAAFGAALPQIGVASISPETFLATDARQVVTRPIKGTRPRSAQPEVDAAMADDLATSLKDRAENVMVVDMERNDLGRVCEPGSVQVPVLTEVEAHPTVWHLVSTVTGTLRPGVSYAQLLRATFPCGSITGAPKVAAMQLIEQLEPVQRGWYCGAIGFLGAATARMSVAIRTATLQPDGQVDYGTGGGIVADSDPEFEAAEARDKAAAFLRAVGVADDSQTTASLHAHTDGTNQADPDRE